jgi:hypothetical protein
LICGLDDFDFPQGKIAGTNEKVLNGGIVLVHA